MDREVYAAYPSFADRKVVGILWSNKVGFNYLKLYMYIFVISRAHVRRLLTCDQVDHATWFGANLEFIHCIQMLPFTPISEELLPSSWIAEEYPVLRTALTRPSPIISSGWKGFVFLVLRLPHVPYLYIEAFLS
jgi:hypothetical protein